MKHTTIFSRWICLVMLLGYVGVSWGQTGISGTIPGGTMTGSYKLTNNVTINNTIVAKGTLTIDLNGYVLNGNGKQSVLDVPSGATLIINDNGSDSGHAGTLDKDGVFQWTGADNYTHSIKGGTILNKRTTNDATPTKGITISGTCIVNKANIIGCYSNAIGAAVTVSSSGNFTMNEGQISYNYSKTKGGAIYANAPNENIGSRVVIKNTTISHNKAENNGGALHGYNVQLTNCTFALNDTPASGGGIFIENGTGTDGKSGQLSIEQCTIQHNRAGVIGGGFYSAAATTITNTTIDENWAVTTETGKSVVNKGRGGGFCISGATATLTNSDVTNNQCMYYGGGAHIASGATLTVDNSRINKNVSILHGAGGLHITGNAALVFNSGQINENTAYSVGGAIHSSYDCDLTLVGGEIKDNVVYGRGGGVHVNTGGELLLQGTEINGNKAYIGTDRVACVATKGADGKYTFSEITDAGVIDKTGYGGGVLIDAGTCTMSAGSLDENYAEVGGGGIGLVMINMNVNPTDEHFLQLKVVEFNLVPGAGKEVSVSGNTTDGDGAGIYLMENTMVQKLQDNNIIDANGNIINSYDNNIKTQINNIKNGVPQANINGGSLTANIAENNGGALCVNGNMTMNGGTFEGNVAKNNGGGIFVKGGTLTISQGNIIKNSASHFGGGIYVENNVEGAEIELKGNGIFKENTAAAGGGLAVSGPFTFKFAGKIENNTAKNGGGIYLLPGSVGKRGTNLQFNGGFIRNNSAEGTPKLEAKTALNKDVDDIEGVGGGVFMADYTTMTFNITKDANGKSNLGFYGNMATNAADDIFANGNNTSITLPVVSDMDLLDFNVPTGTLYWVEDYYSHYDETLGTYEKDESYASGTNQLKDLITAGNVLVPNQNLRYQFALKHADMAHIENAKIAAAEIKTYLCLALGYQIFYVTIQKSGLAKGESAIFDIFLNKQNPVTTQRYITMLLTGDGNSAVAKKVALPQGNWTVTEKTPWTWAYTPVGDVSVTKDVNNADVKFEFSNTKTVKSLHDEDIQVNKMGVKK